MRVQVGLNVAALVVATTLFYTYVGQLVPQKEVPAPPPPIPALPKETTTADLVELGKSLFEGKGQCSTCHGLPRFPDLDGIATRAATRVEGLSAIEYIAQSMYEPDVYIVEGFAPGMQPVNKPPIGLNDDEIRAVMTYLQTLGGEATITMDTPISYQGGAPAEGEAPADSEG